MCSSSGLEVGPMNAPTPTDGCDDDLTLVRVQSGEVSMHDIRVHPDMLRHQAQQAEELGNPQLAANLRRGAELCVLSDEYVLGLYEALRPGRSTRDQLLTLADELKKAGAPECAELVSDAAKACAPNDFGAK